MSLAHLAPLRAARSISPQLLVGAGVFAVVALFMLVRSPVFFMPGNIINVLVQTGMLAILATAMTVVMVGGGIDLSLPANMALAGIVGSLAMIQFDSIVLGCAVMIVAASLIGAVNGFAVAYLRMIPFVVTLATMTCGGLSIWLTNSVSISDQPSAFFDVLLAKPFGVPVSIVIMVSVVALMQFVLVATRFGFQLYAVGTNVAASSISRVPVRRVLFRTYLIAGFLAGIAAIVVTARLGSASANMGNDSVTLDIITACVIGGVSIYGGVGRPLGALFGAVFVLVLGNVLNLLGISFFLGLVLKGVIIIALVAGDRAFFRRDRMSDASLPVLTIIGLRKSFGQVRAVIDANLTAFPGQAVALMGANGAGKSTMMNMLGGLIRPDAGDIRVDGRSVSFTGARAATEAGIAFVHQELSVFPTMTVAENIFIGDFPLIAGRIDRARIARDLAALLSSLGAKVSSSALVSELSVGERQMVEIARAMRRDPRIVIFDEPTSSLSSHEKAYFTETIRTLKARGVAIIYITHFVSEIFSVCDRVVVMRNGETVADRPIADVDHAEVVRLMLGEIAVRKRSENVRTVEAEVVLRATNLNSPGRIEDASFEVHRGEILGLWGLLGAGRTELVRGLLGYDGAVKGSIELRRDRELERVTPETLRRYTAFVTEDRRGEGLLLPMSVADNIALPNLLTLAGRSGILRRGLLRTLAEEMIRQLSIRVSGPDQRVETLSGGNQQKVVFSKWLASAPHILILDEPTRGLDLNAKADIIQLTRELANTGVAVIVISSELEELMQLAHRYLIVSEHKVTGQLPASANEAQLVAALSAQPTERQAA